MPFALERWGKDKAIVVNTTSGAHKSLKPIPLARAEKHLILLSAFVERGMVPRLQEVKKESKLID